MTQATLRDTAPGASAGNIAAHLVREASARPDADALFVPLASSSEARGDYLRLSFRELERETAVWAARLRAAGIRRGTRSLVLVRPGLPLIAVTFALFRIGAVPVLIDPGMGLRSFLACVSRTRPEALVAIPLGQIVSRIFFPRFRSVRHRIRVPGSLDGRLPASERADDSLESIAPDDIAALLFTSGSTGMPKGVVYRHRHFDAQIGLVRAAYDIRPGEVDMTLLPIFALFNPALGMATVVPEIDPRRPASLDPARIVRAIRERGVTNAFGAPPLWKRIAAWCEERGVRLDSMRRILLAGAPVPPPLLRRLRSLLPAGEVHTPYGATECLPLCTASGRDILALEAGGTLRPGSGVCVGMPVSGMRVAVVQPSDGPLVNPVRCAVDEPGEVLCSGPVVTDSYDALPEQTARAKVLWNGGEAALPPALWHRMGDIGRIDASGRLWFLGRQAERVITPARTFYAEEVEPTFNLHPDVERSALVAWEGPAGAAHAAMVIEPRAGAFPKNRAAREALASELSRLIPGETPAAAVRALFFVRRMPVDVRHNAKIHRLTLTRSVRAGKLGAPTLLTPAPSIR